MKGYVNLTHTNNSAIEEVSQKIDEIQDDYVTKDTSELTNYYTKSQTYTKEEIDNKTTNVYRAKGSVQTYQDLPTTNNQVGDVYNVIEAYEDYPAGSNFVWTDTSTWDALGGEISVIQGVSQENFNSLVNNEILIKDENGGFAAGNINEHGINSITIGNNAESQNVCVAIGDNARADNNWAISIGANSNCIANYAIQLGRGTNNVGNSLQIKDDNIYKTDTHTLTVQNAEINGTPAYGVLSGTSAPTTTTVGAVGQFYLDTTNKQLYQCMSITTETIDEVDTNVYEWSNLSESGASQEDFDKLVNTETQIYDSRTRCFLAGNANNGTGYDCILIGNGARSPLNKAVMIGNGSGGIHAGNAICIGYNAQVDTNESVRATNVIQLGKGTNKTSNSIQVFDDNIYKTDTHTLTVNNIEQNGNPVYAVLQGTTTPDTTTVGAVTQFYLNTTDKKLYQCKSITTSETDNTSTYEWQEVGGSSEISNKLYLHSIIMTSSNDNKITTILINSSSNQFNVSSLNDWLISNGFIVQNFPTDDNSNMYLASGSQGGMIVNGIYSYASNGLYCNCSLKDDNGLNNSNISLNNYNFIDTVIQIL